MVPIFSVQNKINLNKHLDQLEQTKYAHAHEQAHSTANTREQRDYVHLSRFSRKLIRQRIVEHIQYDHAFSDCVRIYRSRDKIF